MDGELDFTKYEESELVEMFGRMDPRFAPQNYARLKTLLTARGYIIRDATWGAGSAVPSAEKLQALVGSPQPIQLKIQFDQTTGLFRWLEPAHNEFGFVGAGTLEADGISLRLTGRRAAGVMVGPLLSLFQYREQLSWRGIVTSNRRAV